MNERREQARLNQPVRALVALVELVVAAVVGWGAVRMWDAGVHTVVVRLTDGTELTSTRWVGSWMAGAIGLGMIAAILLVDAVREVLLAVRTRHRPRRGTEPVDGDYGYFAGHLNQG